MAKKKKTRNGSNPKVLKKSVVAENAEGYLDKYAMFKFERADIHHESWGFNNSKDLHCLFEKLKSYETMKWSDIDRAAGGRRHGTNSHHIEVTNLCKKAQEALKDMNYAEDEIYSLRLSGTVRLFGLIRGGILEIIWLDTNHEICPVKK